MHRVAESLVKAEIALGLTSVLVDPSKVEEWVKAEDADVHIIHTHFPDKMRKRVTRPLRLAWVGHGTPDHVFQSSVEEANTAGYGHGDGLMLMQHWLKNCDAKVTFWERHKWIYDTMLAKGARPVDCVPMGVDLDFWKGHVTQGKFAGEPSVFTAENPHYFKWPYDLLVAWRKVMDEMDEAKLHAVYIPRDMHRQFFPFFNATGASYGAYLSPGVFDKAWLKNAFVSCDFVAGLVRYGDLNHISLEANAAGANTISYAGNPYSKYWVSEGDQRELAKQLLAIFKGEVEPRTQAKVPDISTTATEMVRVYGEIA